MQEKTTDEDIKSEQKKIEPKEIELSRLETEARSNELKRKNYEKLLDKKQKDKDNFETTIRALFSSMGNAYPLIIRVNNLFVTMKKKKDEMDKKKSNNRLLQAMQNDMLYKELKALVKVNDLGGSRYQLKIERTAEDFKKRISVLKKYFEGKNKFYENRGSILSAFSLNMNTITSAFVNNSPKNVSFNINKFGDLFTSPSTPTVPTMGYGNQAYSQSMLGRPSEQSYYPGGVPGYGMMRGGAMEIKQPMTTPTKKPNSPYEFITILDKIFEDLKTKVRSNEVYENRVKLFIDFLDQRDGELNKEILFKLKRVEKISKPQYQFLFPAQIRFITRRMLRIQEFMTKLQDTNTNQMKHIYMTDFILMYFSMHYILSNFLDFILKFQKYNELNA
jgi:hypothetical protein